MREYLFGVLAYSSNDPLRFRLKDVYSPYKYIEVNWLRVFPPIACEYLLRICSTVGKDSDFLTGSLGRAKTAKDIETINQNAITTPLKIIFLLSTGGGKASNARVHRARATA